MGRVLKMASHLTIRFIEADPESFGRGECNFELG